MIFGRKNKCSKNDKSCSNRQKTLQMKEMERKMLNASGGQNPFKKGFWTPKIFINLLNYFHDRKKAIDGTSL